jgi:CRP-like cAMP-binding protein
MSTAWLPRLIQIPLCRGLTEGEAAPLLRIAEEGRAPQGQPIFREGDPGDALYVLLEGTLDILKRSRAGDEEQLARLSEGSVFGEMSLLSGNAPRSASAVARSEVRFLRIPGGGFSRLLEENDLGALKIVHNLAQVMSRRLLLLDEKLVELLSQGNNPGSNSGNGPGSNNPGSKKKEELQDFQRILTHWSF